MNKFFVDVPSGQWLIIYPASGKVLGISGRLVVGVVSPDHPYAVATVIPPAPTSVMIFDGRALVIDAQTHKIMWNPRKHLESISPDLRNWFKDNPDVFNS